MQTAWNGKRYLSNHVITPLCQCLRSVLPAQVACQHSYSAVPQLSACLSLTAVVVVADVCTVTAEYTDWHYAKKCYNTICTIVQMIDNGQTLQISICHENLKIEL